MPFIKRYANRKLYDTDARCYVTLEDIAESVRRGEEVRVVDHETGRDLTSLTLFQIIFEEQKKLGEMFPQVVLTNLIRTGEDTLESLRSRFLAAFDPTQQVDDEICRRMDELVGCGALAVDESRRLLKMLLKRSGIEPASEPEPAPPQAVDDLLRQVQILEQELEALKLR